MCTTPVMPTSPAMGVPAFSIGAPIPAAQLERVKRCKNFLATLLRLAADKEKKDKEKDLLQKVKDLVQKLIVSMGERDGRTDCL